MTGADVVFVVLILASWTAGCLWWGFIYGWTECLKSRERRDATFKWMDDYANGKATFADAPWRKV